MKSFGKITVLITGILILGFILSALTEKINLFPVKQQDVSSLINTIWQVHASIATTSIAILALLIGLTKEKKYGFKTLDFMLNINRGVFKFHEEITISLLLLVIQYLFVSMEALSGAVFVFITGVYIILRIFYCSIKLVLFEDRVNEEIREYIFRECISSIELENKKLIEKERNENG